MPLKKSERLLVLGLCLVTVLPYLLGFSEWGRKNYLLLVFFSAVYPIYAVHSTPIGLRFRNIWFSLFWLLMILVNGLLYSRVLKLWIPMLFSFVFYHFLRLAFRLITGEEPIPLFLGTGSGGFKYNPVAGRTENWKDFTFSLVSFFGGLILSMVVLMVTR